MTQERSMLLNPQAAIAAPTTYKVLYAYSDTHPAHKGRLKVGDATLHSGKGLDEVTQSEIEAAARARIDGYTKTADIAYTLEHAELAVREVTELDATGEEVKTWKPFRDYDVHSVLMRAGHKKIFARADKSSGEWFEVPVEAVRAAIATVKAGGHYLPALIPGTITLRPEQEAAVKQSLRLFKQASLEEPKKMLWNAKMRFGKTLTSYKLVEALEVHENLTRVLILTHRPDVNEAWSEDFVKSGLQGAGWTYGSKRNLLSWEAVKASEKLVWFASIQDLRGSERGSTAFGKETNRELFETEWDLVVNDEVHEGTMTDLAKLMFASIKGKRYLDLSGTPFNVLAAADWEDEDLAARFAYDGRYHWSYPDERKAKKAWEEDANNEGKENPYGNLPEVRFVTYDVSEALGALAKNAAQNTSGGISFTELFRTQRPEGGRATFVHREAVLDLLQKMRGDKKYNSDPALFPYHRTFANYFNHTLWMLPHVDACEALEDLLKTHESGFAGFRIVNATGVGRGGWEQDRTALAAVKTAISESPHTITLSQQMLTTGVTVPEWTAVFMLNNTTSPMLYMQTAFRAASPWRLPDGRVKETAYIFDFHPARCLREIVEVAKANAPEAPGDDPVEQAKRDRETVEDYLEYISVLSLVGAKFVAPDSDSIMEQLNEAYISEVVEKGFDSPRLWNGKQLESFSIEKVKILEALRKLQGGKDHDSKKGLVVVTSLSDEERALLQELEARGKQEPPEPLGEKEAGRKQELEAKEKAATLQERKNRQNAVSILAGVAARLPMLVFASPADVKITPGNFASLVDDASWELFMPKNLLRVMPEGTKPLEERQEALGHEGNLLYWEDVRRFFDPVIFSLSCERLRRTARENAEKPPLEAAFRTATLFGTFKNPDKETVLTPHRVVELQYTSTMGGLSFLDLKKSTAAHSFARLRNKATGEEESHPLRVALTLLDAETHELAPVWVEPEGEDLQKLWEDPTATILDINSKTALYPLFAACSFFWQACGGDPARIPLGRQRQWWKTIVEEQVFANCKVDYAALIARRVLAGYDEGVKVNVSVVDVLALKKHMDAARPRLTQEEKDALWKWLFDVSKFSTVGERVETFLQEASDES